MIETTQSMVDVHGQANLPLLLRAGKGRITGAHFGTYDYTASATSRRPIKPWTTLLRQARNMMMWAYGGRGLFLSDGATNVMPVGPLVHPNQSSIAAHKTRTRASSMRLAPRYKHVRHSLSTAFIRAGLASRAAAGALCACYAFFLEVFPPLRALSNFVERPLKPR